MTFISDWFIQLDPTLRFYWGIAIFASIVVIIQMTMSFAGMGDIDSGDADADFNTETDSLDDAGSMHLLSIRNIFYFLLGFGWAGISLWDSIPNTIVLGIVSALVGCLFVAIFIFLFRQMMKLQNNGAFNINIDCTAEPVQIGAYRYIDPEGWAALGDKTGYITLQPGLDLIMVGVWDGEEVIDSGEYSRGGFPDYLRRNYARVYNLAKASGPFSLIPHVELEGA